MFCCTLDTYSQSIEVRLAEFNEQYPTLINSFKLDDNHKMNTQSQIQPHPPQTQPNPPPRIDKKTK